MMKSRDLKLSGSGDIGSGVTTMVQCRMWRSETLRKGKLIHHRLALRWPSPALLVGRGWTLRENADESQNSKHDTIRALASSTTPLE